MQPVLYAASHNNVLGETERTQRDVVERGQTYITSDAGAILGSAGRLERQIEVLLAVNGITETGIGDEKQRLLSAKGSKGMSISGKLAQMARLDFSTTGIDSRGDLRDSLEEAVLHARALNEVSSELIDKTLRKMRKDIIGLGDLDDFHKAAYLAAVDQGTDPLDLEGVAGQFADYLKRKDEAMKADPDAPVLVRYAEMGNNVHTILLEKAGEGIKFNFDPDSGKYGASIEGSAATYEPDTSPYTSMYPQDRLVGKTGPIEIPLGNALDWETYNGFTDKPNSLVPITVGSDAIIADVRDDLEYQVGAAEKYGGAGNFENAVVREATFLGITDKVFAGPEGEKLLANIAEFNSRPKTPQYSGNRLDY